MSIRDKRNEAQKRLKAVQSKINRLRREKGVEISGTQHDVRVESARLGRYNSRQLDAFIERANNFVSRKTQFVGGANGVPLPADKFRMLQKLEKQYTSVGNSIMDKIGDIQAPFSTKNIRARDADMRPTFKTGGEPVDRTFAPVATEARRIQNVQALDKFIEQRIKQNDPEYALSRVNSSREQLDKMLTRMGADEFKDRVNALSNEQFFVFWEYGPYAGDIALQYDIVKRSHEEMRPMNQNEARDIDDINAELDETLTWAATLPSDVPLASRKAKARSRRGRK